MRQYNHKTTGATFCEIDYGKKMPNGHVINVVYTDGVNFIHSQGWFDTHHEAAEFIRERAKMFGVKLTGFERVA